MLDKLKIFTIVIVLAISICGGVIPSYLLGGFSNAAPALLFPPYGWYQAYQYFYVEQNQKDLNRTQAVTLIDSLVICEKAYGSTQLPKAFKHFKLTNEQIQELKSLYAECIESSKYIDHNKLNTMHPKFGEAYFNYLIPSMEIASLLLLNDTVKISKLAIGLNDLAKKTDNEEILKLCNEKEKCFVSMTGIAMHQYWFMFWDMNKELIIEQLENILDKK